MEIALAIPASNDEKYNSYTSISGSWYAPRPGSQSVNVSFKLKNPLVSMVVIVVISHINND